VPVDSSNPSPRLELSESFRYKLMLFRHFRGAVAYAVTVLCAYAMQHRYYLPRTATHRYADVRADWGTHAQQVAIIHMMPIRQQFPAGMSHQVE
jgi:hypothetical protein